jgi:hypothetical protein
MDGSSGAQGMELPSNIEDEANACKRMRIRV